MFKEDQFQRRERALYVRNVYPGNLINKDNLLGDFIRLDRTDPNKWNNNSQRISHLMNTSWSNV